MRTEITIDGADQAGANYITWAPVHSSIRLAEADGGADVVDVLLQNQNPNSGKGQVVFRDAIPGEGQDRLRLRLPADGTPVDFFVAGKFGHPSEDDKDAVIEAVEANTGAALSTKALMVRIRKNANDLTEEERDRFLSALAILNNPGNGKIFRDLRNIHTNDSDGEAHGNAGFLPWHRAYLLDLERELQLIDPSVALPYWRFDEPAPNLFDEDFMGVSNGGMVKFAPGHPLGGWTTDEGAGIRRTPLFDAETSASPILINQAATMNLGNLYAEFRRLMEGNPHASAHLSFTGSIRAVQTAATDPLFFLLHCNVDRLWAKWQRLYWRFNTEDPATYPRQGSPGATRIGHRLEDTMWPWNGVTGTGGPDDKNPRPRTAPGGPLADSPTTDAPGREPKVRHMIDYQGVIAPGKRLGFGYDDVRFAFRPPPG
jgi:tyrosinase